MNTNYKEIKGKKVLLFSGGMDCYIINQLEKPDVLLYIDNHSNYSENEKEYLKKMKSAGFYQNLVFVEDFINMSSLERTDYIIPSRNAYFILLAAEYGDEIILGATSGDRSTDKDYTFAGMMTGLLNHIYEKSHWVGEESRNLRVNFKYKDYTKQMLIRALIEKRMEELNLSEHEAKKYVAEELSLNTKSCYDFVDGKPCGVCKPCTRKWLAIVGACGIDTGDYFSKEPLEYFTPEVIDQWIARESGPNNRGPESREIIDILTKLKNGEL